MILHHGTSLTRARSAILKGLLPRAQSGLNSFPLTPAHPHCVYLTDTYPLYFAENARRQDKDDFAVVISIDTSKLIEDAFLPDEDALEQINRGADGLPSTMSSSERTQHYRRSLSDFMGSTGWETSLSLLGTCAFMGTIAPEAFASVAVVDTEAQAKLMIWATDFSISLNHFRAAAETQKMLTHRATTGTWPAISTSVERSIPEGFRSAIDSRDGLQIYGPDEFREWITSR